MTRESAAGEGAPAPLGLAGADFDAIFAEHVAEVFRYVAHRAGNGPAEELTAETFARAFAARGRFDAARGTVGAWLYGIATNVVRGYQRDEAGRIRGTARPVPAAAGDRSSTEETIVARQLVRLAVARLRPQEQDVLYLVGGVGLTYEEAATALGVPIGTVRSRYARARRHAARHLRVAGLAPTTQSVGRTR